MGRAPCCEKVGLKKGRWTTEEDQMLTKYIQANGEGSWRSLPKNAGLLRCGKSCRLRWINYLRADLKRGNISSEEESVIVKMHASFGNRWSLIASHLPGRSRQRDKNYWNSHLSRKVYSYRGTTNNNESTFQGIVDTPPKHKGGRTSRWAMKKTKNLAQNKAHTHEKSKETHDTDPINENVVPLPPTPPLQSENLLIDDFAILDIEKEEMNDVVLRSDLEGLNINEMLDNCWVEPDGAFDEVRKDSGDMCVNNSVDTCCDKKVSFDDLESSASANVGENGVELRSCPSVASGLDMNWDWESMMQFDFVDETMSLEPNENLLRWLCEDDDWEKDLERFEEKIDPEKQNAMVAWFFS